MSHYATERNILAASFRGSQRATFFLRKRS
jgi:hypothetical protein